MVYCPKCELENFPPSVAHGKCAWCGYDLNAEAEAPVTTTTPKEVVVVKKKGGRQKRK